MEKDLETGTQAALNNPGERLRRQDPRDAGTGEDL